MRARAHSHAPIGGRMGGRDRAERGAGGWGIYYLGWFELLTVGDGFSNVFRGARAYPTPRPHMGSYFYPGALAVENGEKPIWGPVGDSPPKG